MTKIEVSEASGPALDWMVAKCEGWSNEGLEDIANGDKYPEHDFSTNWAQGGPIIEREGIRLTPVNGWQAGVTTNGIYWTSGPSSPTPLVAAMRCYVASKLGDVVDVPEELGF